MTNTQRELLRAGILSALQASGSYCPTLEVIRTALQLGGHGRVELDEIKCEALYLKDKGFCEPQEKAISPENARWRITAAGRDYLATEGLA